jgi:hypothetical protein
MGRIKDITRASLVALTPFVLAGFTACASAEVSPEAIAEPKAKISAAEEAGANENPRAALHLKLATDAFENASKLIKDGDGDEAKLQLKRASVDAELALQLARLDTTRMDAERTLESIQQLEKEHRQMKAP